MPLFKPGDKVRSVTGGPQMEVVRYLRSTDQPPEEKVTGTTEVHRNTLTCKWHDGQEFHSSNFDENELERVEG